MMIETLIELQRLKRLDRTGWVLRGLPPGSESVGAHSYGVAVVAMVLADEFRIKDIAVDIEKVLRMALLHDAAEVRMGDLPRTAVMYFGAEVRAQAETAAFRDIVEGLGIQLAEAYSSVHLEYELRNSLESRIVKAADLIDLLLQALAFERSGARGLDEFWDGVINRDFGFDGPAAEIVRSCLEQLLAERHKIIRTVDPCEV
jgi:putative hydrolase of HD superfamily